MFTMTASVFTDEPVRRTRSRRTVKPESRQRRVAYATVPVLALEASITGLEVLNALLQNLPEGLRCAIVLVEPDIAPNSDLAEKLLSLKRTFKARSIVAEGTVKPDHLYVLPPTVAWSIKHGTLRISSKPIDEHSRTADSGAEELLASLTPRQREILALIHAGESNKRIAFALSISQRTVENHRAAIMRITGSRSISALCRWCTAAFA